MSFVLLTVLPQANAYAPNWGQTIFASAHNMVTNTKLRESLDECQSQAASEREWWERRRGQIQNDFMKELDDSSKATSGAEDDAVIVDTPSKGGKKKGKK